MKEITVSQKGWIVIPKELREKYGLTPGTKVYIVDYAGRLTIVPAPKDPITEAQGFLKKYPPKYAGPSIREELIAEHREEVESERTLVVPRITAMPWSRDQGANDPRKSPTTNRDTTRWSLKR